MAYQLNLCSFTWYSHCLTLLHKKHNFSALHYSQADLWFHFNTALKRPLTPSAAVPSNLQKDNIDFLNTLWKTVWNWKSVFAINISQNWACLSFQLTKMCWLKISSHELIAMLAHIGRMYWARKHLACFCFSLSLFHFFIPSIFCIAQLTWNKWLRFEIWVQLSHCRLI